MKIHIHQQIQIYFLVYEEITKYINEMTLEAQIEKMIKKFNREINRGKRNNMEKSVTSMFVEEIRHRFVDRNLRA